jgi:hypothetical protein
MVCIVSCNASLVHHFWAWFVLFHFHQWFIIAGHGFYCFTSITGSSLLGMVCIVSLHASWFSLTVHGFYYFTSCITDSSLLGMVGIASLHYSLVYHCWAWLVLFHLMRYWFFIAKHVLYCFTS